MEDRFDQWLKDILDHRLRDTIRHSRYTQYSLAAALLWDCDAFDRWWKIAPRRKAIPNPIEVRPQALLKLLQRLPIDTRCPSIKYYPQSG